MRLLTLGFILVCFTATSPAQDATPESVRVAKDVTVITEVAMKYLLIYSEEKGVWLSAVLLSPQTRLNLPSRQPYYLRVVKEDGTPLDAGWIDFHGKLKDNPEPIIGISEFAIEQKIAKGEKYEKLEVTRKSQTIDVLKTVSEALTMSDSFVDPKTNVMKERTFTYQVPVMPVYSEPVELPLTRLVPAIAEEEFIQKIPRALVQFSSWQDISSDLKKQAPSEFQQAPPSDESLTPGALRKIPSSYPADIPRSKIYKGLERAFQSAPAPMPGNAVPAPPPPVPVPADLPR